MLPLAIHRFTDRAMVALTPGLELYPDGFGDLAALEGLVARIRDYADQPEPEPVQITWESGERRVGAVVRRRGWFRSPAAELLPPEVRTGELELDLPAQRRSSGQPQPICLLLSSTGDEGFWMRRAFARPLWRAGIGTLLLQNPFYGSRRARGQRGPSLRTVAHQFAMNLGTVEEARALLRWLRNERTEVCGVTGYSQGGFMAGFAAALSPFPVAVIPRGAGSAAAPIFTNAALSRRIVWSKLAAEMGSEAEARQYLERCLEPVQINRFSPPVAPEAAVLINARGDGFVPPAEAEALHRHWLGSELRWVESGHVSANLLHLGEQQRAVLDAFAALQRRLQAG
ncbi:MAG: alpha/beta hydrolase family protein [Deltaproteobacteria bacterium]|jgi:dienelactone hydrolase|nr:alpha/beta hydrolase family protein [Deltaproteobacteria bacterium]MBW2531445.1 alpha/beta hydrolase family protein [Deltaproteobacteria bacterium]